MLEEPLSLGNIDGWLAAAEPRRVAPEAAPTRRRQRLFVAGLFVVAVIVAMVLAVSAYAMPGPCARASLAGVARSPLAASAASFPLSTAPTDRPLGPGA
jgi:hypothetical protein